MTPTAAGAGLPWEAAQWLEEEDEFLWPAFAVGMSKRPNEAALREMYKLAMDICAVAGPVLDAPDAYLIAASRKRLVDKATRMLEAALKLTSEKRR